MPHRIHVQHMEQDGLATHHFKYDPALHTGAAIRNTMMEMMQDVAVVVPPGEQLAFYHGDVHLSIDTPVYDLPDHVVLNTKLLPKPENQFNIFAILCAQRGVVLNWELERSVIADRQLTINYIITSATMQYNSAEGAGYQALRDANAGILLELLYNDQPVDGSALMTTLPDNAKLTARYVIPAPVMPEWEADVEGAVKIADRYFNTCSGLLLTLSQAQGDILISSYIDANRQTLEPSIRKMLISTITRITGVIVGVHRNVVEAQAFASAQVALRNEVDQCTIATLQDVWELVKQVMLHTRTSPLQKFVLLYSVSEKCYDFMELPADLRFPQTAISGDDASAPMADGQEISAYRH